MKFELSCILIFGISSIVYAGSVSSSDLKNFCEKIQSEGAKGNLHLKPFSNSKSIELEPLVDESGKRSDSFGKFYDYGLRAGGGCTLSVEKEKDNSSNAKGLSVGKGMVFIPKTSDCVANDKSDYSPHVYYYQQTFDVQRNGRKLATAQLTCLLTPNGMSIMRKTLSEIGLPLKLDSIEALSPEVEQHLIAEPGKTRGVSSVPDKK